MSDSKGSRSKKTSTAAAWRKKASAVETVTLNSGMTVKYRRVVLLQLAQAGVIPKNLLPSAIKADVALAACTGDQLIHAYTVQQHLVVAALVEPQAVMSADEVTDEETQIWVGDIPRDDLEELGDILMGRQRELADPTEPSSTATTPH